MEAVVEMVHRPGEARAEWLREAPAEWSVRLRQISPVTDRLSHLRFRWRDDTQEWWLYECFPAGAVSADRVEQLTGHWSTLPKSAQKGRQRYVTEYQFWMWRTHRLDVYPFWVLQGSKTITGGTPYSYTRREQRMLEADGLPTDPIPAGTLPAIPFDERVAHAVLERDRLAKVGGDLDALVKQSRPEWQVAADEIVERDYRQKFLAWHHNEMGPCSEFMKWWSRQDGFADELPPAPEGLANVLADWKDQYIETGILDGAGHPIQRTVQVAVR